MIVEATLSEGGKWHKVRCTAIELKEFFLTGELDKYSPTALRWPGRSVVYDTVIKKLGFNPIRKAIA